MNKTTYFTGICLSVSLLTGCSDSDFTPVTGMDAMDIYANACVSCHGENGSGKIGGLLKLAGSAKSPEEIVNMIRNGGQIMPAFPNIDPQQAELIATYIKSM